MFCSKCGEKITEELIVCPKCGAGLSASPVSPTPSQPAVCPTQSVQMSPPQKSQSTKTIIIFIIAVISVLFVAISAFFITAGVRKAALENDIQKEWKATDGSIIQVLEFNDGVVQYRLETGYYWLDTTLFTSNYEVINGNKIIIEHFYDKAYTVKFNDDKTVMTITPAVTSTDSVETWYYIG